jgi:hypothetical protein
MSTNFSQDPTPTGKDGIPFAVEGENYAFVPKYYPERFTQTRDNELKREGAKCAGEEVYTKKKKNKDLHATGIVLADNLDPLRNLIDETDPIDIISPIVDDGGAEVVLKSGKIGEIVGWDGADEQWQFKYTLDFVTSGADNNTQQISSVVSGFIADPSDDADILRELKSR